MSDREIFWQDTRGHLLPELDGGPHELSDDEMLELTERQAHLYLLSLDLRSYIPCSHCRKLPHESKLEHLDGVHQMHDACIPELPGVRAACCGHGVKPGYVLFNNGSTLYGGPAHVAMKALGGNPPPCLGTPDIAGITHGIGQ